MMLWCNGGGHGGPFYGSVRVQQGALRQGIAGIYWNRGIVESVTYRI